MLTCVSLSVLVAHHPAFAGCVSSNVTVTECDTTNVLVNPNTGTSSLTVNNLSTGGIRYTPGDSATGSYTQSLTLSGSTTVTNLLSGGSSIGGGGVVLKTALANQNVSVTTGSGVSITAYATYGGGIWARSETSGDISINNAASVTVTGVDGSNNPVVGNADGVTSVANLGSSSVINSGTVTTNGRGLYSEGNGNSVTLDAGLNVIAVNAAAKTVSINNSGTVNATLAGARAIDYNGLAKIDNSGSVTSTTRQALVAWSDYGNVQINNSGTAISGDRNAIVGQSGANGNVSVTNSGTVSASKAASTGSAGIGYAGIRAYVGTSGDINVTNQAGGHITSNYDAAIVGQTPLGAITIVNNGTLSGLSGIFADSGSGTSGVGSIGAIDTIGDTNASVSTATGAVSVTNGGTITTTSHSVFLDGTTNSLNNSGSISSTGGVALLTGGGNSSVSNSGAIKGQSGAIYGTLTSLANSGLVAGSITNSGTSTLVLSGGSSNYGLFTDYNGGSASLSNPGTVGTLTSQSANLSLTSGMVWLNDNVDLASGSFNVGGNADLKISNDVTVTGSYVQNGGTLTVTGGSKLVMAGTNTANIQNSTVTLYGTNLTAGTYTLVDANAVGIYANNSLKIRGTAGLTGTLSTANGGDDYVVSLSKIDYTIMGKNEGGISTGVGSTLDAILQSSSTTATTFQNTVLTSLSDLTLPQQQKALKQLSPTQVTPSAQATQAAAPTTSVIEQHELALLEGGTGSAAGSEPHSYGIWGQVLGGGALRSSSDQTSGYRSRTFGLVSGLDSKQDDGGVIGAALSWTRGWNWGADNAAGTYSTMDSYQLTGYGLHRFGNAFADWQLGFGYNVFDQSRSIAFLNQQAKANFDGQQYLVKLGSGYDIHMNDQFVATPLVGLRFLRSVSDGYTESGSDDNLTIDRRGVQSLTQDIGGKLSWKLSSDFGQITPEVRLAWVHDYTRGPIATSGLMGGQLFTTSTARPSPDGARINLAVTLDQEDDFSFRAEYEGEVRPDYQSHTGLAKATWAF